MSEPQLPIDYYRMEPNEVLRELTTHKEGLSAAEASSRLERDGPNSIHQRRKDPPILTYLRQFKDLMILLLLGSSIVAWYLGDPRTALVLVILALFNTTIGFLQEFKAGRLMDSLEKLVV